MIYGYVRVSTTDQKEDRQLDAMTSFRLTPNKIFTDKQSGKDFNRTHYKSMIKRLKEGDVVLIKSIDRLGRNYDEILEQWRIITKVKRADIVVIDMPILDTTQHKDLLGTFISDLVLQLLSYVAECERHNIKQRQAEGIAAAKARGVYFGRPIKYHPEDYVELYMRFKRKEISQRQAMKIMGACKGTYYKVIKQVRELTNQQ
jgi:DNA invertase Pin-like site-specific DNA recombinase